MENDKNIVIIPDIHGRDFWKRAVKGREEEKTVFLGDYLDPYHDDMVFWSDAMWNFKEIISFKKDHPDNVVLLLGNHDLHYLFQGLDGSRKNIFKGAEIARMLEENLSIFSMAHEETVKGKRYLFTHAGISTGWMKAHPEIFPEDCHLSAGMINPMMFTPEFVHALEDVSHYRGGWDDWGSMIWADACEFMQKDSLPEGIIQIVGHTRHAGGPIELEGRYVCLDCGEAFLLSPDRNIKKI
ncbi:MAG: metallophosphoesterase [Bacteroidales bacterium]|nr:metallophosphoesterase [Bacteroidales bacterium]